MRTTYIVAVLAAVAMLSDGVVLAADVSDATMAPASAMERPRASVAPDLEARKARLAAFLCPLHEALRWRRGKAWTPQKCMEVAAAFVDGARAAKVHDLLGLATAVQESDTVEGAIGPETGGKRDSGLMGVRCPSDFTKGIKCSDIVKIGVNVRLGMSELAYWRTVSTMTTKVVTYWDREGRRQQKVASSPCVHGPGGHEAFLHYNNGTRSSADPYRGAYDRRVGAIYTAIATRLGEMPTDLEAAVRYEPAKWDRRTTELVAAIRTLKWSDPNEAPTLAETLGGTLGSD